jgi:hypothetical protein
MAAEQVTVVEKWDNARALWYVVGRLNPSRKSDKGRMGEVYNPNDIVNAAFLLWREGRKRKRDGIVLHYSIGACLFKAWREYWADVKKHRDKLLPTNARRYHGAKVRQNEIPYTIPRWRAECRDIALTPKQRKLLSLLFAGYRPSECASILHVTPGRITALMHDITAAYHADNARTDTPTRKRVRLHVVSHTADIAVSRTLERNYVRCESPNAPLPYCIEQWQNMS